jgi:sodium/hydrogen antiporter
LSGSDLALVALAVGCYALVSRRLAGTWVTGPLVFTLVGLVVGVEGLDILSVGPSIDGIKLVAEVTLALVLFSDASRLDLTRLRQEIGLPARLLGIGLPLSILLGAGLGALMFPGLLVAEALVLAVLLAPTDAALGQAVVSDPRLPTDVRQGLNVESGLNDGICVPLLVAAIALVDIETSPSRRGEVLVDLVKEASIAVVVGVVAAGVIAVMLRASERRGWVDPLWARIVPLSVVAIAYPVTAGLHGSGFIACFVAGLVFGGVIGPRVDEATELVEEAGSLLSGVTFFFAAAVLLGPVLTRLSASMVLYALVSLSVVRMLPVALSLIGIGVSTATKAFTGWFGPRGLATIVFTLTVVRDAELPAAGTVVDVAAITVALSIVAHGVSAPVLIERFARRKGSNYPLRGNQPARQPDDL